MKEHQGIWLPDHESHLPEWMDRSGEVVEGRGTYQIRKLRKSLEHVRRWRNAIDVGAHVGLWSMHLAPRFGTVHAFEPVAAHRECFQANVRAKNVVLYHYALGAETGFVRLAVPRGSSGGTHVAGAAAAAGEDLTEPARLQTLDHFDFHDVDYLKVDCEGYELEVLKGARELLTRCRPCVVVEQKPHKLGPNFGIQGTPAVDLLRALGAEVKAVMSGDYILAWD